MVPNCLKNQNYKINIKKQYYQKLFYIKKVKKAIFEYKVFTFTDSLKFTEQFAYPQIYEKSYTLRISSLYS